MTAGMLFVPLNPQCPCSVRRPAGLLLIPVGYGNTHTHTVSRWGLWHYKTELRLSVCLLSMQSPNAQHSFPRSCKMDFKGHIVHLLCPHSSITFLSLLSPFPWCYFSHQPNRMHPVARQLVSSVSWRLKIIAGFSGVGSGEREKDGEREREKQQVSYEGV